MRSIRAGLDRYLSSSPIRKPFSTLRDREFKVANEVLHAHLKDLARKGIISSTKHTTPTADDLERLYENGQLGTSTPEKLLQTAWFYMMLYFGKRGRGNQRAMTKEDLELQRTTAGVEYFVLLERATKNLPGGLNDKEQSLMAWPNHTRCPVKCLKT